MVKDNILITVNISVFYLLFVSSLESFCQSMLKIMTYIFWAWNTQFKVNVNNACPI